MPPVLGAPPVPAPPDPVLPPLPVFEPPVAPAPPVALEPPAPVEDAIPPQPKPANAANRIETTSGSRVMTQPPLKIFGTLSRSLVAAKTPTPLAAILLGEVRSWGDQTRSSSRCWLSLLGARRRHRLRSR